MLQMSPKLGFGLLLCIESILDGIFVHFSTLSSFLPYCWSDGRRVGWLVSWLDGWMVGQLGGWTDRQMDGWSVSWLVSQTDGQMDGRLVSWSVGWLDGLCVHLSQLVFAEIFF